jgi:hypothetical protein
MNSASDQAPRATQPSGAAPGTCLVCGDPIGERCFCKMHGEDEGPRMLCCPDCTIQYLASARAPADTREQEIQAYEKSGHFFIGEDKPWL